MQEMFDLNTEEGMAQAVAWQTSFCKLFGDGGKWGVPRSMAIYTIYNSKKLAERTAIVDEDIDLVFKNMGWEVKEVS